MGNFRWRAAAFATCLLGGAVVHAAPMVYDFAGTGDICQYNSGGSCWPFTRDVSFVGTITIDVLSSAPGGSDSSVDPHSASDLNGWVESRFVIEWAGNQFISGGLPNQGYEDHQTSVWNDLSGQDRVRTRHNSAGYVGDVSLVSLAELTLSTFDTTWLNDLSFPVLGLAPPSEFTSNRINFSSIWYSISAGTYSGFTAMVDLSSLTQRTGIPVAEPATVGLLGLGIAGLGLARRRRLAG